MSAYIQLGTLYTLRASDAKGEEGGVKTKGECFQHYTVEIESEHTAKAYP